MVFPHPTPYCDLVPKIMCQSSYSLTAYTPSFHFVKKIMSSHHLPTTYLAQPLPVRLQTQIQCVSHVREVSLKTVA